MSVVRLAFLGTPDIASYCLQALIEDEHFQVVGVLTQPDRPAGRNMKLQASPVKQLAEKNQIPVLTPEKVGEESVIEEIRSWRAEAAVVVAYGQILPRRFLDLYPKKVVNVHASLLPRWRGAAPIQRALMAGDEETGVSLQIVVPKLDAGDVLGVRKIKTEDRDALELLEAMKPLAADLLEVDFMDYLRGNLTAQPQDESRVTYAPKLEKTESKVDWNLPAREIYNRIRGLKMGPGSYCFRQGKKLKIHKVSVETLSGEPGKVLRVDERGILVACGKDSLLIQALQPESRTQMSASDFVKGQKIQVGEVWS